MGAKAAQPQATSTQRPDRSTSMSSEPGSPPQIGETAEMRERRRKQNRLAQQAFRARQKVRVEALESEWSQLRQLHEALNQACSQRDKEIQQLHIRVEELLQDIELLKQSQELEKGWPSSPSPSTASSYASSSYDQPFSHSRPNTYSNSTQYIPSQFAMGNYFGKGVMTVFPDFPLAPGWLDSNQR